jgi:hypothetical protein
MPRSGKRETIMRGSPRGGSRPSVNQDEGVARESTFGMANQYELQKTLKNANARDVEDTDRMKVFVMRYFDIVKVNVADMTPKIIIKFLVK